MQLDQNRQANRKRPKAAPGNEQWFCVPDQPILDEHSDPRARPPYNRVDGKLLYELASNSQHRCDDTDDDAAIVLRHTPVKGESKDDPPIVGFANNFGIGSVGRRNPRQAVIADLWYPESERERLKRYPRVSVEIWPEDKIIDPIAMLGSETPKRDIGPVRFGRYETTSPRLLYQKGFEMADMPQNGQPSQPGQDQGGDDLPNRIAQALSELPAFKVIATLGPTIEKLGPVVDQLSAMLDDNPATDPDAPPEDPNAPPDDMPADSETAPLANEDPDAPPDDPEQNNRESPNGDDGQVMMPPPAQMPAANQQGIPPMEMQRYQQGDEMAAIKQRLAALEAQAKSNGAAAAQYRRESREQKLTYMRDQEGYRLEVAKEMTETDHYTDDQFKVHCDRIKERYARAPINVTGHFDHIRVTDGGAMGGKQLNQELVNKAMAYARRNNCSMDEAYATVLAN